MEQVLIDSIESYERTQRGLSHLLSKRGSERTAVALAEALVPGQGQEPNVRHLRACVFTDAGIKLKDPALVQEGVRIWGEMEPHDSVTISYNLASAHLYLWQLAVEQSGLGDAWLDKRSHLRQARRLFSLVAQCKDADTELRLKALTDCGNSFDNIGRYLDALNCYDQALKLDSSFGMASGNRGITLLNVASLMGGHESHLLLQAASDLDVAISDQDRVLRCGGQSAVDTFKRRRAGLSVQGDLHRDSTEPSPQLGDSHLDWCLRNQLFLHISPDCIRAETETLDTVTFRNFRMSLAEDSVLDRANEIVDGFNAIKQDYVAARYLVWLATAEDSPIQGQAAPITRRSSFWDTSSYADWGVKPGIGVQALKVAIDTLDTVAVFVHLYFRTGRKARNVDFRTLPYTNRSKKELAASLSEALKQPENNRGLASLFDISDDVEESSLLGLLFEHRHAATHRFFSVHNEKAPESSDWIERLSWHDITEESLESLRIVRGAIMYLPQMIHLHEKATDVPDSPGSMIMPLPFEQTDADLMEPG